ncbi:MAG TPA: hypothetical protein VFI17_05280 [Solirubrobacterales bacterium]|nr:hypothetical protein [Solirubrobacterales bacterium]
MSYLNRCGLAAVVAWALVAIAGGSQAAAAEFHAAGGTALNGVQVNIHVLRVTGNTQECNTVSFTGTAPASGTSEIQKLHPSYSNCTAFGFINPTFNTSNCTYEFRANTNTFNLVECANGGITISTKTAFGNCGLLIPNQEGINGVSYINMNTAPNRTLTIETNSTNMKANVTEDTGVCPLTGGGMHNTVTYTGLTGVMGATGETFRE